MEASISVITLGVQDLERAKAFYGDGLGWPVLADHGPYVSYALAGGGTALGLVDRSTLAGDAGVAPGPDGCAGMTLSYLVSDDDRVAGVLAEAEAAGATITKPAEAAPWGGSAGHFLDPEGFPWKVATADGLHPTAE